MIIRVNIIIFTSANLYYNVNSGDNYLRYIIKFYPYGDFLL